MQINEIEDAISNVSGDSLRYYKKLDKRIDDLEKTVKALADKLNEVIVTVNKLEKDLQDKEKNSGV